jgi:hypothetical protein
MHSLLPIILASSVVSASPYHANRELFADLRNTPVLATRSTSLLGDLLGEATATLSAVGAEISSILTGVLDALADGHDYTPPGDIDSPKCAADTCCKWSHIMDDIRGSFSDGNGCSAAARGAIRLGFHDAAAWDSSLPSGGADGSVVLNSEELGRNENRGLQDIAAQTQTWFDRYKQYNITSQYHSSPSTDPRLPCCGISRPNVICSGRPHPDERHRRDGGVPRRPEHQGLRRARR